jgi:murein DD-endopeptidase MepM/ murein hydrolase activator NlpD
MDLWGLSPSDNYYLYIGTAPELVFTVPAPITLSNWPVDTGTITSNWGSREEPVAGTGRFHSGIDIGVPDGTPVYATGNGTVAQVADHTQYGNVVVITMDNGLTTADMHLNSVTVPVGSTVTPGQQIATSGNTGTFTTGGHDHFTVWSESAIIPNFGNGNLIVTGATINPREVLPPVPSTINE